MEEKNHYLLENQRLKSEYEHKILAATAKSTELIQEERMRIMEREKEMDKQYILLKQQLLDEHNNSIIKEKQLRNETELAAKQIALERDLLKRRVDEAQEQLDKLSEFKEKYTQKMEESMAQYKIDLNKEFASMLNSVEVEKTKLLGDRQILQEKEHAVEKGLAGIRKIEEEALKYKVELTDAHSRIDDLTRGRDSLLAQVNDLQLQLLTHKGSSSLEFEITSLKK